LRHSQRTFMEELEAIVKEAIGTIIEERPLVLEGDSKVSLSRIVKLKFGGNAILVSNFNRDMDISDNLS